MFLHSPSASNPFILFVVQLMQVHGYCTYIALEIPLSAVIPQRKKFALQVFHLSHPHGY